MNVPRDAPTLDDLRDRVREFLHARGMKQREAARILGVPQSTLSRLLDGHDIRYSTGADLVAKLNAHAVAVDVDVEVLTVTDVMTRRVQAVSPEWSLERTQRFLAKHDFTHAPLALDKRRYGELVSRRKVTEALAAGTDPSTPIAGCKNLVTDGEPGYVQGSDKAIILVEQLRWRPLLLVMSSANHVKGVVTRANISLLPVDAKLGQQARSSRGKTRR